MAGEESISSSSVSLKKGFVTGQIVNSQYEVIREVAEGGFGLLLEVIDKNSNEHLAMKVELEEPKQDEPGLHLEASVLRRLQGYNHILKYYDEDTFENCRYLVMQLSGLTLTQLRLLCRERKFTTSTIVRVSLCCLEGIENVHLVGLVHRDVKPGNFVIGLGEFSRIIYIIDFGLARRYLSKDGTIRPPRPAVGFRGSVRYASINAHKNIDLGCHDDVWSWLYMIVELRNGALPWSITSNKKAVGEMKMKTTGEQLLKNMQPEYRTIYLNLETLTYDKLPPYSMYRDQLKTIMKRRAISSSTSFDWEVSTLRLDHTPQQIQVKKIHMTCSASSLQQEKAKICATNVPAIDNANSPDGGGVDVHISEKL